MDLLDDQFCVGFFPFGLLCDDINTRLQVGSDVIFTFVHDGRMHHFAAQILDHDVACVLRFQKEMIFAWVWIEVYF